MNLVIVGCSRRKLDTTTPVPALDLYQGWCVPRLRARIGHADDQRDATFVLSARHGLIPAATALVPYDQPLTRRRVTLVQPQVNRTLTARLAAGWPNEVLLLLEPDYLALVAATLTRHAPPVVHWIARPDQDWDHVAALLDRWGWL